jgi:hypothetical protein
MRFWLEQVLIAFDQLINAMIGGWADETLSSVAYRMELQGARAAPLRKLIDRIFFWQPEHCKQAYESERIRSQASPETR